LEKQTNPFHSSSTIIFLEKKNCITLFQGEIYKYTFIDAHFVGIHFPRVPQIPQGNSTKILIYCPGIYPYGYECQKET
jgi:hypothetical protein